MPVNALLSPKALVIVGWVFLVASLIGWPLSALTVARDEPQFILGLSWLAIAFTAFDIVISTTVNKEVSDKKKDDASEEGG
jgi:uncharacterized membrane protein YfcA